MPVRSRWTSPFIRSFAFVRKELLSVWRQPRLLLTLVVGPFLILFLFGLGYRQTPDPLRTLVVVPSESASLATDLGDLSQSFGGGIELEGTTTDTTSALSRLERGDVDLVIIAPSDALESLDRGERASITIVHSEVDPVLTSNLRLLSRLSVNEINRHVLAGVVDQLQADSSDVGQAVESARQDAGDLVRSLEQGDHAAAARHQADLVDSLAGVDGDGSAGGRLYDNVASALGSEPRDRASGLLESVGVDDPATVMTLQEAQKTQKALEDLDAQIEQVRSMDPELIVSPFAADVRPLVDGPPSAAAFYAPGVLIVLLQHLAITFAALSLVKDKELGITDVFRASPLSVGESLVGKYLAFLIIGGTVALALTIAMIALGLQIAGPIWAYATVIGLVLLAALGVGFAISGVAATDSQAVQYSMIILMFSIFFSGFILPLEQLRPAVRSLSYLLPATYGVRGLDDVMFRGEAAPLSLFAGISAYALVAGTLAWLAVRSKFGARPS